MGYDYYFNLINPEGTNHLLLKGDILTYYEHNKISPEIDEATQEFIGDLLDGIEDTSDIIDLIDDPDTAEQIYDYIKDIVEKKSEEETEGEKPNTDTDNKDTKEGGSTGKKKDDDNQTTPPGGGGVAETPDGGNHQIGLKIDMSGGPEGPGGQTDPGPGVMWN